MRDDGYRTTTTALAAYALIDHFSSLRLTRVALRGFCGGLCWPASGASVRGVIPSVFVRLMPPLCSRSARRRYPVIDYRRLIFAEHPPADTSDTRLRVPAAALGSVVAALGRSSLSARALQPQRHRIKPRTWHSNCRWCAASSEWRTADRRHALRRSAVPFGPQLYFNRPTVLQ